MIADLKPYPVMKSSGVEWLGEVPEHWEVRRLCYVSRIINGATPASNNSEYWDGNIVWLTPEDLGKLETRNITGSSRRITCEGYNACGTSLAPSGSLVLSTRAPIGHIGILQVQACVNQGCRLLAPNCSIQPEYFYYELLMVREYLQSFGQGSTFTELSRAKLAGFYLSLPPLPEQAAIVHFLDYMDRRISKYINAKQKLIKLLEEQKQAIIHSAVTRGLDPNVPLKPSGVEWLGDVPTHWEVRRLKAVLLRPLRNGLFKKKNAYGKGVPLVNVSDVYRENFQIDFGSLERVQITGKEGRTFKVQSGDIFFVRSSLKLDGTGRSAVAIDCEPNSVFECHLVQGRPDSQRTNPRFLAFQLNSYAIRHYFVSRANVVTMATIAQNVLSSCPVFLPSLTIQDAILEYIDNQNLRINAAIKQANLEIRLLREYWERLITDIVTGKLDVRKVVTNLYGEVDDFTDRTEISSNHSIAIPEEVQT